MKFSLSFLATAIEQLPPLYLYGNEAVEAIIFHRRDLEDQPWKLVWENVKKAIKLYGKENVTFHFPVQDSSYIDDPFVLSRVLEGYQRSSDLGLHAMVVHANQVHPIHFWKGVNLTTLRKKVIHTLADIKEKVKAPTPLCLENMPAMDNDGKELDALFNFPADFEAIVDTPVSIIWDHCHYTNTLASMEQIFKGEQDSADYPNIAKASPLSFLDIKDKIAHWHFSSFIGIANPRGTTHCKEGVLPCQGTLPETLYKEAFQAMCKAAKEDAHVVFEVQEKSYLERIEGKAIIEWARLLTNHAE